MRVTVVALCAVMAAILSYGEAYKEPIVMITSTYDGDAGAQERGAGIIFATYAERVYVVAVRHILFDNEETADRVTVEFYLFPGEPVEGKVNFVSQVNDVAVLLVKPSDKAMFQRVSEIALGGFVSSDALTRGDEVYKLGFPDGKKWDYTSEADSVEGTKVGLLGVDAPSNASIVVNSQTTKYGHSGGVFLDSDGRYVGMIHGSYGL